MKEEIIRIDNRFGFYEIPLNIYATATYTCYYNIEYGKI